MKGASLHHLKEINALLEMDIEYKNDLSYCNGFPASGPGGLVVV
jgi:hypothetical protein